MCVDRVGLAALAGGEHPRPSGKLGRDIDHGLAVGDQALCEVTADALTTLNRPGPIRVLAGRGLSG
jgi:hypothetical protein